MTFYKKVKHYFRGLFGRKDHNRFLSGKEEYERWLGI